MPDKEIKAVLFDLGETILSFGRIKTISLFRKGARSSYDFLKRSGIRVGWFEWYCWTNLMMMNLRRLISHISGNDFDSLALLKGIYAGKRSKLDSELWQEYAWCWYKPLCKIATVEPDIAETLGKLKDSGIKLGIVSNTFVSSSSLDRHLEQLSLLEFFEFTMYSYQFDFRKPDHRIFNIAAEKVGEEPANIVFVGDRIDKDIEPSMQAGMQPVLISAYTNAGKDVPEGAYRIEKLSELPGLIEKINSAKAE
jgi:HAD superfamily hydrolase (TIGR01549 family)